MQRIAILYDASQAVLSTFDLDEVLSRILGIVRDVFHLHKGAILLMDAKTQELYLKTQFGWDPGSQTIRVPLGSGLTGTAAQTKKPVYAPDVSRDPRYIRSMASTRSEVAIPLMVREEVVGVLDCQSEKADFFDEETLEMLRLFSTQASIALANARLYSLEQRRRAQLEAINAIARQTTAVLEISQLLKQVCSLILESFGGDHASVLLFEDDRLVLRAHQGRLTPLFKVGAERFRRGCWPAPLTPARRWWRRTCAKFTDRGRGSRRRRRRSACPWFPLGKCWGRCCWRAHPAMPSHRKT